MHDEQPSCLKSMSLGCGETTPLTHMLAGIALSNLSEAAASILDARTIAMARMSC